MSRVFSPCVRWWAIGFKYMIIGIAVLLLCRVQSRMYFEPGRNNRMHQFNRPCVLSWVVICEFRYKLVYKPRYTYLKFRGHHLRFSASGFFPFCRTKLPLVLLESVTPKSVGIAVGMFLMSCLRTDKYVFTVLEFEGLHLRFCTSDVLLTSVYHQYNSWRMSVTEKCWRSRCKCVPTNAKLNIYYMLYAFQIYLLLPALIRHIGHPVSARLVHNLQSCRVL